jgi:hypothetical protein
VMASTSKTAPVSPSTGSVIARPAPAGHDGRAPPLKPALTGVLHNAPALLLAAPEPA